MSAVEDVYKTASRLASENAQLRAEKARLVEALRRAREWFDKAEDSEAGADYLNGDGRTDGSDGWGDADIVAEQISAAIAAAEGRGGRCVTLSMITPRNSDHCPSGDSAESQMLFGEDMTLGQLANLYAEASPTERLRLECADEKMSQDLQMRRQREGRMSERWMNRPRTVNVWEVRTALRWGSKHAGRFRSEDEAAMFANKLIADAGGTGSITHVERFTIGGCVYVDPAGDDEV